MPRLMDYSNIMDERREQRYQISEIEASQVEKVYLRFEDIFHATFNILDLSLHGACVESRNWDDKNDEGLDGSRILFARLYHGQNYLLLGTRFAWYRINVLESNKILRCGIKFEIITPEDQLDLARMVQVVRISRLNDF